MCASPVRANSPWRKHQKHWINWFLSLLLLAGTVVPASAQFLIPGELMEARYPNFNEDSIAKMGIKSITLRTTDKPSSSPIYDRGRRAIYRYDKAGRLISFTTVFPVRNSRLDTIQHEWKYMNGILVEERSRTGSYLRKVTYTDSLRSIQIKHRNEPWQQAGKEVVNISETSKYRTKTIAAPGQKPYETVSTKLNASGDPETQEIWNGPRLVRKERWAYSDTLTSYELVMAGELIPERFISYIMVDGREDHGQWCLRAKCKEWSMLYQPGGLPKALFFFDPVSQDMEILEFQYVFRNRQ